MPDPRDFLPRLPWQGPPIRPPSRISDYCHNMAFFTSMAYEEAVKLLYDLTMERPDEARLRIATLRDIMPQLLSKSMSKAWIKSNYKVIPQREIEIGIDATGIHRIVDVSEYSLEGVKKLVAEIHAFAPEGYVVKVYTGV